MAKLNDREAINRIIRTAELQTNIAKSVNTALASSARFELSLGKIVENALAIQKNYDLVLRPSLELNKSVNKMIEQLGSTHSAAIQHIMSMSETLGRIQKMLPDKQEISEIDNIIDRSGFDFVAADLELSFLRGLRAKKTVKEANAAFTRRLLQYTNSSEYWQNLENTLSSAGAPAGRVRLIHDGYDAHLSREYSLSVPVFLAQMEHLFTRLLIADGKLKRVGNKIILLENGKPKLNKHNKPIEAMSLNPKAAAANYNDGSLKKAVDHLLDELVADRNDILHGRRITYGKAKMSVQLLLLIEVFADDLADKKKRA